MIDIKQAVSAAMREVLEEQNCSIAEYAKQVGRAPQSMAQKFEHDLRISSLLNFAHARGITGVDLIERIERHLRG